MAAPQEGGEAMQSTEDSHATWPGNLSVIVKKIMLKKIMLKKTEGDCGGKQIDDVNTLHKYKYIYQIRDRSKLRPICKSKF